MLEQNYFVANPKEGQFEYKIILGDFEDPSLYPLFCHYLVLLWVLSLCLTFLSESFIDVCLYCPTKPYKQRLPTFPLGSTMIYQSSSLLSTNYCTRNVSVPFPLPSPLSPLPSPLSPLPSPLPPLPLSPSPPLPLPHFN